MMQQKNNLPRGWKEEPLKLVLITLESGGRPKGGAQKEGVPSIGGEHLNSDGKFNFENMKFVPKNYFESMNRGLIKNHDVLIVKDGATTGKTSFVGDDFPFEKSAVNEHVFIARSNKKVYPKYLFYFLFSGEGQEQLKKAITGSAQGGINLSILDKITVVYPDSLSSQQLIVSAIETQFTRLDEAVKNLKNIKTKLEIYRKSVLKKAFEKFKEFGEFEKFVDILDSRRMPINSDERKKREGNIPYYGATGQVGWIDDYLFDEELILLGEDGAPFLDPYKDKAYIINGKSWINNHAHVLKGKNNFLNKTLLFWLNVINYYPYVMGTTRLKLNQARMKTIPIPLIPVKDQQKIIEHLESKFSVIDKVKDAVTSALIKAEKLRKSILKSAFAGRLVKNGN